MENTRIKISSIVESQLPFFVREDYPLVSELLTEYYRSLEFKGSSYDLLQNIDQYVKVNNLTNLVESTKLTSDISLLDSIINVDDTEGFPNTYGLIYIDSEIILYKSKTKSSFNDCIRGFSGITNFSVGNTEDFSFSSTQADNHSSESSVINLSSLFLKEFFIKTKKQFLPGFDGRELYEGLNENLFLKQSKDFYTSKGTDKSFEILFRVLYGKDVDVILPKDFLFKPSNAEYRVTRNIVVEPIDGNVELLKNKTIFQDQYNNFSKFFGTVVDIEKILKNNKEYYIFKLDYDFDKDINVTGSIFGELKIHPKTKIIDNVFINSDTIVVDSTLGFSSSGTLVFPGKSQDILVSYNGKTVNQFLNCSGIIENFDSGTEVSENLYAYGYTKVNGIKEKIKFRINGVLSGVELSDNTQYYQKGDIARITNLGYNKDSFVDNNWIFNTTVKCNVSNFISNGNFTYTIETYDNNGIYEGDSVEIEYLNKNTGTRETLISTATIPSGSIPQRSFKITTNGIIIEDIYSVKRLIKKYRKYVTDVLNVYKNIDEDEIYITSSSLPSYASDSNLKTFKYVLEGEFSDTIFIKDHGFITGDKIEYKFDDQQQNLGISSGIYYVKKIDNDQIKIFRSQYDIESSNFVSIATTSLLSSSKNTISLFNLSKNNTEIDSQKLIRVIKSPTNDGKIYETPSGTIGILINGVEILNYKSDDSIYYGPIESVEVLSPGLNYDVINPPILEISSGIGSTSQGYCGLEGSLSKINIIDGGFDYIDTPSITISGGGGFGAKASAKMISYNHSVDLNSSSSNLNISLSNAVIGFSTYHKFRDGEPVIYKTSNNQAIGGLTTDAKYYVKVIDSTKIKLHKTYDESITGINTINLTSFGIGNHRFDSTIKKKKIDSIIINSPGIGYKNKKISISSSGINTSNDTLNVYQVPYNSGDVVYYYGGTTNISGLSTGKYYVTKISDTSFKLSLVGIGSTLPDFYYKTNQYVNLQSTGSGNHIFNYEPIEVKVSGKLGISTVSNLDLSAKVQPIFRGKISSIFIHNGGVGYGSSEIINFNKQPDYNINQGSGAILTPVISDGKIKSVIINNGGNNYVSSPDLIVRGFGIGSKLTAIVENGKIIDVKVINSGINYEQRNTIIDVLTPGEGCKLKFYPKTWKINNFKRIIDYKRSVNDDDGIIYIGNNSNYGVEYTHLYAPRSLRSRVYSKLITETTNYRSDYENDIDSNTIKYHSPLLGWAYDGNPIYGPYGYSSPSNKKIKLLSSGYKLPIDNQENRPNKNIFPAGFFTNDYVFDNNGDLDEHNGRFCITPEYPEGTYAYFMTVDSVKKLGNGNEPTFPYIIGNTFKSKPIKFNFDSNSNQDEYDLNDKNYIRNTNPYNTLSENSIYEYILSSSEILEQKIKIENIKKGDINSVKIISGGNNYRVDDKVIFENNNSGGNGASAKVNYIKGKTISGVSQTSIILSDVNFYPSSTPNNLIGFSSIPHNLVDNDYVTINSLSDYDSSIQGSFNIGIRTDNLILDLGVGSSSVTGIVTYFYVSGSLDYPFIRENDILRINLEEIKILNVEKESSRIRVLRCQNSTVSTAHSAYSVLYEIPRKFYITLKNDPKNKVYNLNTQLYFDPKESLGIGTIVGIGYTLSFSNPGIGKTSIIIPTRSIYLKNHKLETGDKLIYNTNSGIGITVSTNGINNFTLANNSVVYATKISNDLIGISTVKVGLGTTGEYVGISQTASVLFLTNSGSGTYHSFTTNYDNVLRGNISKNNITVSTASTHNLRINDSIVMESFPGITTTVIIKYNDYHNKMIVNPKSISSIDIVNNLITINNHQYTTGEKLIYTSSTPSIGLENQGIYYAVVYDENRIRLSTSYYNATRTDKIVVNIASSSVGTLSQINPKISFIRNQNVIFDLSDSSLSSSLLGLGNTSAFDFNLYADNNFESLYFPINSNGTEKITKIGTIGITSTAKVQFKIDNDYPEFIYYNLVPKINQNSQILDLEVDTEVFENNKIVFTKSNLNGTKIVTGITSNSFIFQNYYPENINYSTLNGDFRYYTNSKTETGEIESIQITSGGLNYEKLPSISTVSSLNGSGSILIPQSKSIGKINVCSISDIGYNFSVDNTLKPFVKFPSILRIEPLSTIESIDVLSPGLNYNTEPDLIVIDGFTNTVVEDIKLKYDLINSKVNIITNSNGFYDSNPKIIPINNSNGLGISSISYNSSTKIVTAFFNKQFSDVGTFPFSVGDNIFVEGVSVLSSSDKGFNSKNYNYSVFPVVGVNTNLGGSGSAINYSLENYISSSENTGIFNSENSSGRIISENDFPKFKVTLRKNSYIIDEEISSDGLFGTVLKWDSKNEYLNVESIKDFKVGSLILGKTSKSKAFIKDIFTYETFAKIDSSSIVYGNWNKETGFLNNNSQRLQDSDYYQIFSYSLKSEVPIQEWNDVVSNLNHTLGFKKFSDLIIESTSQSIGISTFQDEGLFSSISDVNSIVDIECINDYDLASENYFYIQDQLTSDEIIFNSAIIQDYFESVGNRVLIIDDISNDFNTTLSVTSVTSFNI